MNYIKLFQTQAELDYKIVEGKGLEGQDLFYNKVEALLCEIQETANEQRSWKYWSENREPRKELIEWRIIENTPIKNEFLTNHDAEVNYAYVEEVESKPLLEETVDTFHFILSIGNDLNINHQLVEEQPVSAYADITEQFIALSYTASCIAMYNDRERFYLETVKLFKGLVHLLGFTEEELETAYYLKNEINHTRQATNY